MDVLHIKPPKPAAYRKRRLMKAPRIGFLHIRGRIIATSEYKHRERAMRTVKNTRVLSGIWGLASLFNAIGSVGAPDEQASFPNIAPMEQYRMASRSEEIDLARSAAPTSISGEAEILVLGDRGYETAIKGKNGFVCLVERSWFASFNDPQFWNPGIRGPDCLNRAAVSTVLPANLEKTQWVLAGLTKAEMIARTRSSAAALQAPAQGAIGYMLSKQQRLGDGTHWHPHLMLFQPHTIAADWGADLPGSPVSASEGGPKEPTVFFVPVGKWSDGTPASADMQ